MEVKYDLLTADFNPETDVHLKNLLFFYRYNERGLLIEKRIPGQDDKTSMTYNIRDLLASSTDPNGNLLTYEYDALNRLANTKLKKAGSSITEIILQNYYDTAPNSLPAYQSGKGYGTATLANTKGLLVGTYAKNLAPDGHALASGATYTGLYYDVLGRLIQTASTNHLGGTTYESSQLDFVGRVLGTKTAISNSNNQSTDTQTKTAYTAGGKVKNICQAVGGIWQPINKSVYNGIGELVQKDLGCKLQTIDYEYTMQGWLRKYNDPATLVTKKDFFGMALSYDQVGNIISQDFRVGQAKAGSNSLVVEAQTPFNYAFSYDAQNRLLRKTPAPMP